jgi:hypothetical protein
MGKCRHIIESGFFCGKEGPWGYQKATHCSLHKIEGMKVCQKSMCVICGKKGWYESLDGKARYCKSHVSTEIVRTLGKNCQEPGCKVRPSFNQEGERKPLFCKTHMKEGMINVCSRHCAELECKQQPTFNYEEKKGGMYCSRHKKDGMIDVINRKCKQPNCRKHPSFNYPTETVAIYCKEHSRPGMINVNHVRCIEKGCSLSASCNYKGEKKQLYCSSHKKEGMINVVTPKCRQPNCDTIPTFNFQGQKRGIYCSLHKLAEMVNVVSPRCQEHGCSTLSCFNYEGQKKGIYCATHMKSNMIDVYKRCCLEPGCKVAPVFAFKDCSPRYCAVHKKEGMIDVMSKKCHEAGCSIRPSFGDPEEKTIISCFKHIPSDKKNVYVNLMTYPCKGNNHPRIGLCYHRVARNNYYEGYCGVCFKYAFPEHPKSLDGKYAAKEHKVFAYLASSYPQIIHDKPLLYGDCPCPQKRRIDLRMLIEGTLLCIEIDENQHRNYNQEEEIVRYNDLMAYHTGRMIFIRYNPDRFRNEAGVIQNPPFENRMKRLLQEIEHQIERIKSGANIREDKLIEVVYLFYNANKPRSLKDLEDDIFFHEDAEEEEKEGIYQPSVTSASSPTDDEDCIYIPVDEELIRRYTQSPQKEAVIVLED